jgi:lysophospholipase L1-like esterase
MTHRRSFAFSLLVLALLAVGCGGGGDKPSVPAGRIAYTAIGASDAVGVGAVPLSNGYVPRLGALLATRASDVVVTNLGHNGWEVGEMVDGELPDAIASNPDVVTVWTGTNDVIAGADPADFAAELDLLLSGLAQNTTAQVFVADLVDVSLAPSFVQNPDPDVTPARIQAFNDRIHAAVDKWGFVRVDLSAIPFDENLFWIDGFHPNNDGYAAIAAAFWAEMKGSVAALQVHGAAR